MAKVKDAMEPTRQNGKPPAQSVPAYATQRPANPPQMSLREWYVGQALEGAVKGVSLDAGDIAHRAVEIADAALARLAGKAAGEAA